MKRFSFSLERMRNYKDQMLDKEKNTLRQLQTEKSRIEDEIVEIHRESELLSAKMQRDVKKGVSVANLRLYDFQKENMRRRIHELQEQVEMLDRLVEKQLSIVVSLSQEVSGLDKLEEKQRDEYNHQLMKADELFISELISSKIVRERL